MTLSPATHYCDSYLQFACGSYSTWPCSSAACKQRAAFNEATSRQSDPRQLPRQSAGAAVEYMGFPSLPNRGRPLQHSHTSCVHTNPNSPCNALFVHAASIERAANTPFPQKDKYTTDLKIPYGTGLLHGFHPPGACKVSMPALLQPASGTGCQLNNFQARCIRVLLMQWSSSIHAFTLLTWNSPDTHRHA